MDHLTLDLEANAASAILKLQMLIRKPCALEGRYNYVIAAIDPQSHIETWAGQVPLIWTRFLDRGLRPFMSSLAW